MTQLIELETDRLRLRQWTLADRAPFALLNSDPRVMKYLSPPLTRAASDAMADRCQALLQERGWGFWAVEDKASGEFSGFVGLHVPSGVLPFSPCVEIGWRLAAHHWGKGLATEAARAALRAGFEILGLTAIVSFTALENVRSRAVMGRLGMREAGTFQHPHVPEGNHLRLHCLYRLARDEYLLGTSASYSEPIDYRLVPALISDEAWLERLRREVYQDLFQSTWGRWDETRHARQFAECLERGRISIIEMASSRVGMIQLFDRPDAIEVSEIQIQSHHQNRGIGTCVLRDTIARAHVQQKKVLLSVALKNEKAYQLYARLGFRQVAQTDTHHHMASEPAP